MARVIVVIVLRQLLLEEAVVQAGEALAMTGLVAGHLVDGVMDGVKVLRLGEFGDAELVLAGACLGGHAFLKVGLGVPYDLTQQFGELGGMLGLLKGVALEGLGNLGITLTVGLARHGKIHAHLRAFALEVCLESGEDFGVNALGNTDDVLGGIGYFLVLLEFLELLGGLFTLRTFLRGCVTLVYITAHGTDPFFSHNSQLVVSIDLVKLNR